MEEKCKTLSNSTSKIEETRIRRNYLDGCSKSMSGEDGEKRKDAGERR